MSPRPRSRTANNYQAREDNDMQPFPINGTFEAVHKYGTTKDARTMADKTTKDNDMSQEVEQADIAEFSKGCDIIDSPVRVYVTTDHARDLCRWHGASWYEYIEEEKPEDENDARPLFAWLGY